MYSKKSYFHLIFLLLTSVMFSNWNCMSRTEKEALLDCARPGWFLPLQKCFKICNFLRPTVEY